MKKHQFEEITLGISILIAISAWSIGFKFVACVFFIKSCFDVYCLIKAINEKKKSKIVIAYNQNNLRVTYQGSKNETIWLLEQAIDVLKKENP